MLSWEGLCRSGPLTFTRCQQRSLRCHTQRPLSVRPTHRLPTWLATSKVSSFLGYCLSIYVGTCLHQSNEHRCPLFAHCPPQATGNLDFRRYRSNFAIKNATIYAWLLAAIIKTARVGGGSDSRNCCFVLRWPVIDGARSALQILPFASHPRLGGSPLLQAQGPTHNPAYHFGI